MSTQVRILSDSISQHGERITTWELIFPRMLLAELNTHRMFSRNSASSRAIPPELLIARVKADPFIPTFNERVKGMGVGPMLNESDQRAARNAWLYSRDKAVVAAEVMLEFTVDKSRINRLLEPFLWHTAIVTATDWSNFFALRAHPAAQPEFQELARMMLDAYEESQPQHLEDGQWHLPLLTDGELAHLCGVRESDEVAQIEQFEDECKLVSTRRTARVSFDKHTDSEPWDDSVDKAITLIGSKHLSPAEHPARPFTEIEWEAVHFLQAQLEEWRDDLGDATVERMQRELEYCGNLHGWVSFRKEIEGEHDASIESTSSKLA